MKTAPWFDEALPVARGVAAFFALISMVGFSWFGGSSGGHFPPLHIAYHYVQLLGLITFAFLPRKWLSRSLVRWSALLVLCAALVATLPQILDDLRLIDGADYPAVTLRCLACVLLVVGGTEIWRRGALPQLPNQRLERP
jgi:hypothetical protein